MKNNLALFLLIIFAAAGSTLWYSTASAAPSPNLWPHWQTHSPASTQTIDHSPWNKLLTQYLDTAHPSKINRFRYADFPLADTQTLTAYLDQLQKVKVLSLNRQEQKAYWVNLYNALTVQVILDHYPVKSIMDIDISPGFFSNGPWDAKLVNIEGKEVSLNDIEHRILRPIFNDNRLHYALNCASIGCPNLQPVAFTAANIEELLETSAREYINSPRGAQFSNDKLKVSSIYKWFRIDFGNSEQGVIRHLLQYAQGHLANTLQKHKKGLRFGYDWQLNQP